MKLPPTLEPRTGAVERRVPLFVTSGEEIPATHRGEQFGLIARHQDERQEFQSILEHWHSENSVRAFRANDHNLRLEKRPSSPLTVRLFSWKSHAIHPVARPWSPVALGLFFLARQKLSQNLRGMRAILCASI
jgi:hypothetical protein